MGTVQINGKTYHGNNVSMINDRIIIDGKEVTSDDSSQMKVLIQCQNVTFQEFQCTKSVEIHGDVIGNISCDGSFSGNNITGNVSAGGSVSCDDIGGSVKCGGSVSCDDIGGSVTAGGSVSHS